MVLADGGKASLRCLRPEDRDLLVEGFRRLSPESRYYRFFSAKDHLTDAEIRYLTEIDGVTHFAIGAVRTLPDGRAQGMGIARFIRMPDRPDVAEPALAVADDCQRKGLGTTLFARLVEAARERGVVWFECHVLGENHAMKALLDEISDEVTWRVGDNGAMVATFPVAHLEERPPDATPPEPSPARRLLQAAARQIISLVPSRRPRPGTTETP